LYLACHAALSNGNDIELSAVRLPSSPCPTCSRSSNGPKPLKNFHTRVFCRNVRAMATPGCSFEGRFAECMKPTILRDVFRASSCAKHIIYIIDAFEIVLGHFRRISVISKIVASSDEWCDNDAFGGRPLLHTPLARVRHAHEP
jgi:hypothetical protein